MQQLWKYLRRGRATAPALTPDPTPSRGFPAFRFDACIACGRCAPVCPTGVISIADDAPALVRTWSLDYRGCVRCTACQEVCPTQALVPTHQTQLAATSARDLEGVARFQLVRDQSGALVPRRYLAWRKETSHG
ncbi:MAG: 4Fe-4S binding protein [Deinococcus sp.]|nr:4Fe-4S binding protein [Deinococcus sp.]